MLFHLILLQIKPKILNSWYKTLCFRCHFITSRQCKTITTIDYKYQSIVSTQTQNQYLDNLIAPSFQGAKYGDDYTNDCLLEFPYFKKHYKVLGIDLDKQQEFNTDSKPVQPINLIGNLYWAGNITMLFILEESK